MSLGDFASDLRDLDFLSSVIDAILDYMTFARLVWIWRNRDTQEMWISAHDPDEDSEEEEEEE
jgi:hypothetical protein